MHNHTIFITGASPGIGLATAKKFASEGARLILLARREQKLKELQKEYDTPMHFIITDISDTNTLQTSIKNLPAKFADIDVLVNNAGITLGEGPIENRSIDDMARMVDVNINGTINCTQLILPKMVARNRGHIINIGSSRNLSPSRKSIVLCFESIF